MGEYFFRFSLLLGDGYDSYSKHMPCKHVNKILGKSETYFFHLRLNAPAHIVKPNHKNGKNSQVNF